LKIAEQQMMAMAEAIPAEKYDWRPDHSKVITRKLWGIANQHPFGHHGKYTTMREAVLAHAGEAAASRAGFNSLAPYDQNSVIEFLKSLQILLRESESLCVDEEGGSIGCPAGVDP
jgi:CxxC motif-containing protein (DUF1111 family)